MKLAVKEYKKLLNRQDELKNRLKELQREKDLKLDTISNKYECKIGNTLRSLNEIEIILNDTRIFVTKNQI